MSEVAEDPIEKPSFKAAFLEGIKEIEQEVAKRKAWNDAVDQLINELTNELAEATDDALGVGLTVDDKWLVVWNKKSPKNDRHKLAMLKWNRTGLSCTITAVGRNDYCLQTDSIRTSLSNLLKHQRTGMLLYKILNNIEDIKPLFSDEEIAAHEQVEATE